MSRRRREIGLPPPPLNPSRRNFNGAAELNGTGTWGRLSFVVQLLSRAASSLGSSSFQWHRQWHWQRQRQRQRRARKGESNTGAIIWLVIICTPLLARALHSTRLELQVLVVVVVVVECNKQTNKRPDTSCLFQQPTERERDTLTSCLTACWCSVRWVKNYTHSSVPMAAHSSS